MASYGWYDQDGNWHDPDEAPPGREAAPNAPPGYTVPVAPPGAPPEETAGPAAPPPTADPGPTTPTWTPPHYTGPTAPDLSWLVGAPAFDAPVFTPPPDFSYGKFEAPAPFAAPDANAVLADPGYQLRRDEGAGAVRAAAASLGKLRTGGTIKDLLNYNQNFASREYGNVYDRSLGTYNTNYNNQWNQYLGGYNTAADTYKTNYGVAKDTFDTRYKGALDMYNPTLLSWQTRMQAQQKAAEDEYNRQWEVYKYEHPSAGDILNAGSV